MKKGNQNQIYLYFVEHTEGGPQYVFCSYKELQVNNLVLCRTCYGRTIGTIIGKATINDLVEFTGLKPCGPASYRNLVQAGWIKGETVDGITYWENPADNDSYDYEDDSYDYEDDSYDYEDDSYDYE